MAITLAQFSVAKTNDLSGISLSERAESASGICATYVELALKDRFRKDGIK
jgi:hypothetical protein